MARPPGFVSPEEEGLSKEPRTDVRNMARVAEMLMEEDPPNELAVFVACHIASLADELHAKWDRLSDQLAAQKAA